MADLERLYVSESEGSFSETRFTTGLECLQRGNSLVGVMVVRIEDRRAG